MRFHQKTACFGNRGANSLAGILLDSPAQMEVEAVGLCSYTTPQLPPFLCVGGIIRTTSSSSAEELRENRTPCHLFFMWPHQTKAVFPQGCQCQAQLQQWGSAAFFPPLEYTRYHMLSRNLYRFSHKTLIVNLLFFFYISFSCRGVICLEQSSKLKLKRNQIQFPPPAALGGCTHLSSKLRACPPLLLGDLIKVNKSRGTHSTHLKCQQVQSWG